MTVNGQVVTEFGTKIDLGAASVAVDGKPVKFVHEKLYILLNKPPGYTSTRSDPHAKHTILELLEGIDAYLYPVGRLDVDTSGLLLLTNDGELTQTLTHPSHEIEKTYEVVVRGRIRSSSLSKLEKGIELEDGVTAPAKARLVSYSASTGESTIEITIHEGRKRQVRRMFDAVGHRVVRLRRIRMGNLDLRGLSNGRFRHLTKKEVAELRKPATPKPPRGVSRQGRSQLQ